MMNTDIFVPLLFLAVLMLVISLSLWFRHRTRLVEVQTMRDLVRDQQIRDPEVLRSFTYKTTHPLSDFRKGILLLSVACSVLIAGVLLTEADAFRAMLAIASFPGLIGLAYLLFHSTRGNTD